MEHKVKVMDPNQLIEPLLALLDETDSVPLGITGGSMSPFLIHGRDTVYLSKITTAPKRGDMILYRRGSDSYVLHRVYRANADACTMVGDAQTLLEHGVTQAQMLARVTAVCRKGKLLKEGSFWWEFFEKVWIRMVPLRPAVRAAYSCLKKSFR